MSDYPIVNLSIDALVTTTRSVRKRLDLTRPLSRHDHPDRLLHRHELRPYQTDSARRRAALRPVVNPNEFRIQASPRGERRG